MLNLASMPSACRLWHRAGIVAVLFLSIAVLAYGIPQSAATARGGVRVDTMSVEDLRPGMRGIGYTVVRGSQPEEFQVEILGVLEDAMPKQDIVIARLSGLELEDSGVAAGMSGSPVYVDGKLVGAVAYRLGAFQKEPIAGLTPIGNMLRIGEDSSRGTSGAVSVLPNEALLSAAAELLAGDSPSDLRSLRPTLSAAGVTPIATPVTIGGAEPQVVARLAPLFEALGWRPALGGTTSSPQANAALRPGSTVAAQLMRGDITFTASGTVTHVDEDQVLAFGHSFLQGGQGRLSDGRRGGAVDP